MEQLKSCGVLLFRSQPVESFLLMQHPDRLDLPKGHIEPGESELACALRELEEETGVPADAVEIDPDFRFVLQYTVRPKRLEYRPAEKTLVIFLGRLIRDVEIFTSEHEGHRWVAWNPPHQIQAKTIDPLLAAVESYRSGAAGR